LVEYDDVVNNHREVIYAERKKILSGADLKANILSMIQDEIQSLVASHFGDDLVEPDLSGLLEDISHIFPLPPQFGKDGLSELKKKQIVEKLSDYAAEFYDQREQEIDSDKMRLVERLVMLRVIDKLWMEHLTAMEHMRQGIGLRAVGQQDPLGVYKREGHHLFDALLSSIQHDVVHSIYHVSIAKNAGEDGAKQPPRQKMPVMAGKKVGRNDPCPCGSGKKYKHCCGR
ncbi:MAG: SEC-C domain-containing protein, partial [Dehalococcoidia bacterium]|nr:SEC-C domain-containing protein [Dehalococcoidia bacterium]